MDNLSLIDTFSEFKELKNINRETLMHVLADVFKGMLQKKYESSDNFDIIINIDKGDLEIWHNRTIVNDIDLMDLNTEISLSEAKAMDSHAEGCQSIAEKAVTHAEGYQSRAYIENMHAKASGRFAVTGDAQYSYHVVKVETTDATQSELRSNVGTNLHRITIPANRTWGFDILLAARQTGGSAGTVGDSAGYEIKGVIKRDDADNTVLVGSASVTTIAEDQSAWDVTVIADDTNEALVIKVTGEANKTIHWVATVHLTEVG